MSNNFTQQLFSSRVRTNPDTYIGERGIIFYHELTGELRISDGVTPGGIPIFASNVFYGNTQVGIYLPDHQGNVHADALLANSVYSNQYFYSNGAPFTAYTLPTASAVTLGGVRIGANININGSGVIDFDKLDLGNLTIVDQTIGGVNSNQDINLTPSGTGLVGVPGLKIPVGSVVQGVSNVTVLIANLTVDSVEDYSVNTSDNLIAGEWGLTNGISGAAPGWTVYRLTTVPAPILAVGDRIAGVGVPYLSTVLFVGNTSGTDPANANIIITSETIQGIPIPPSNGTVIFTTRDVVNAGLALQTTGNVDITFNPGLGGNVVTSTSIIPLVDDINDLGSPAKRFRRLWLGAGTIYILDETLGTDQAIGARDGNLYIAGGTGLNVGKFTLYGNTIALNNSSEDFYIGSAYATGNLQINRPLQVLNSNNSTGFRVDRTGRTQILPPTIPVGDVGALSIIGSSDGSYQGVTNAGGMLHITGNDGLSSRVTVDSFGNTAIPIIVGRRGRGTAATPSEVQASDTLLRLSAVGWAGFANFSYQTTSISPTTIEAQALETFSNIGVGSQWNFYNAQIGDKAKVLSASITASGLVLPNLTAGGLANVGITFGDDTHQTTAWIPANNVNKITVGSGLTQTANVGNVGIDATGVQNVAGTANQINVFDAGSKNLTLSLPQSISSNSTVTFANLTITGNLTVNGTTTTANSTSLSGKILYLANNSTSSSQIDGGGIVLGNTSGGYERTFLYDLNNDRWDTNGAGLKTLELTATNVTVIGNLTVNGPNAHFGSYFANLDYPNAAIQIDENVNSYSQIVSQNHSNGTSASTDFVAVNDIGDDTIYFVDMGINSSNYNSNIWTISGPNDSYLFNNGGDLTIGTSTAGKQIIFHTGNTLAANERLRISDTGLTTGYAITSTVTTGTAPFVVASTTRVNNLNVARSGTADAFTTARTINGVSFDGTANITVTANAQTLTSNTLSPTVVNSSLTSVGTLTNLTVSGNVSTGNTSGTTATFTNFVGTILTASQPDITALGNLTQLNVSTGTFTNLTVTNTINGTVQNGVVTTGSYANPSWIANLAGTKITGTVANAAYATTAGNVINGVYTTDLGTVTNGMLSGNITNDKILNSYINVITGAGLSGGASPLSLGQTLTLLNTGVISVVAGDGISANASTGNIQITNAGVTRATAGTGINVNVSTGSISITNTDLGSSQNIFKNFAVSGQSTVTANVNNDTVNLVAGSGISITTSGKDITFTTALADGVVNLFGANNIVLTTEANTGNVTISRVDGLQTVITGNTSANYSLTTSDQYFGTARSLSGQCNVTLPLGSSLQVGRQYTIKDEGGNSQQLGRNIVIIASGSDLIDGASTRRIKVNYGAVTVLWTGTGWSRI